MTGRDENADPLLKTIISVISNNVDPGILLKLEHFQIGDSLDIHFVSGGYRSIYKIAVILSSWINARCLPLHSTSTL